MKSFPKLREPIDEEKPHPSSPIVTDCTPRSAVETSVCIVVVLDAVAHLKPRFNKNLRVFDGGATTASERWFVEGVRASERPEKDELF